MIVIKLAKSLMEHEEGMNHIWIQIPPSDSIKDSELGEIEILLPDGVYRSPNLNGYPERDSKSILLDMSEKRDLLIEIYTEDAVSCGEHSIGFVWRFTDRQNEIQEITATVSLRLVPDDEMDSLVVDEQVISRLKELSHSADNETTLENVESVVQPRFWDVPNEFSYLEKMYRIDYHRRSLIESFANRNGFEVQDDGTRSESIYRRISMPRRRVVF